MKRSVGRPAKPEWEQHTIKFHEKTWELIGNEVRRRKANGEKDVSYSTVIDNHLRYSQQFMKRVWTRS